MVLLCEHLSNECDAFNISPLPCSSFPFIAFVSDLIYTSYNTVAEILRKEQNSLSFFRCHKVAFVGKTILCRSFATNLQIFENKCACDGERWRMKTFASIADSQSKPDFDIDQCGTLDSVLAIEEHLLIWFSIILDRTTLII